MNPRGGFAKPFAVAYADWHALQQEDMERKAQHEQGFIPFPLLELDPTHEKGYTRFGSISLGELRAWLALESDGLARQSPEFINFIDNDVDLPQIELPPSVGESNSYLPQRGDMSREAFDPKPSPHTVVSEHEGALKHAAQQASGLNDTLQRREEHQCAGCKSKAEKMEARIDQLQRDLDGVRRLLVRAIADIEAMNAESLEHPF